MDKGIQIGLTYIPDEALQAHSENRVRWLVVETDKYGHEILIPLYAPMEAKVMSEAPSEILKLRVAVYRKGFSQSKYTEYDYMGDDYR